MWLTVLIHAAKLIKSDNMSKQLSSFNSYYSLIWGNQSQFQTLIVKKWHKNLDLQRIVSTFAAWTHTIPYSVKKIITIMKEKVLQAMREAGKPVSAGDVTKALGADRKEVDKAFAELKKEGAIVSPVRCKWEPAK